MGTVERPKWLVRVERQCVEPLVRVLGARAVIGAEVGEEFRVVEADETTLRASGLSRFVMPIDAVVATRALAARHADAMAQVAAVAEAAEAAGAAAILLRRHGRFAMDALTPWLAARYGTLAAYTAPMLFAAVSDDETFLGVTSMQATGSVRAGGWPSPTEANLDGPSRAGGKISEALSWLEAENHRLAPASLWLELGSYPGGMTTALVRHGFRVDAVDIHPPSPAQLALPGVETHVADGGTFVPTREVDALLCDINGPPRLTAMMAARAANAVRVHGLVVHTIKLPSWEHFQAACAFTRETFAAAKVETLAIKHLVYNRQEITLLGYKRA